MKNKEQEQAACEAFQQTWNNASREEILKRVHGTQHQIALYAHQVSAFKIRVTLVEEQLAYARRLLDLVIKEEISAYHAQIFLNQVLGEKASWGEPDHGTLEPTPE